jgi:glutathione S-transferase
MQCVFGAWEAACLAEGEEKIKAIESAQESLAFLEKQIEGKMYFGGEEIGFLDLAAGWIPHWLNALEEAGGMKLLDAEKFPSLHEWAQNFIQIPLIRECIPPRDKLLEYFNASISYMRSLATNQP